MGACVIEIEDGVNGYVDLVKYVADNGAEVSPRGQLTLEIEDATVVIHDVVNTLPRAVGRGAVPGIAAVESCQLLAGRAVPELVTAVSPQFSQYQEDDGSFHGAYGKRVEGQYGIIVERLKADSDTRQAVVTIWDPTLDLQPGKRDYPCTILHQFRVRDNKLNMSVYMRSNDVWLGAAYDFAQFTRVQLAIASVLGIEPGTYAHHVGSLHLYETHFTAVKKLVKVDKAVYQPFPYITGTSWNEVASEADKALVYATAAIAGPIEITPGSMSLAAEWNAQAMAKSIAAQKAKVS